MTARSGAVVVDPLRDDDLDAALALNNAAVPHVNELDIDRLTELRSLSSLAVAARLEGGFVGFALVMAPGVPYDSPNYRWFNERHDDVRYLDRIAVDPAARRAGVGSALYAAVFDHARTEGCPLVGCEVNLEPPNPGSRAFHRSLGFEEVGRQTTYGDTVVVQLLLAEVD